MKDREKKMKTIQIQFNELWNRRTEPKNNSPVFDYCRKLISDGEGEKTILEVYRGEILCLTIKDIGAGAKLAIREDELRGPELKKYKPFPKKLIKQGTFHV